MAESVEHRVARERTEDEQVVGPCCDMHGRNCESPADLCCWLCTEVGHVWNPVPHSDGSVCSAPDLSGEGEWDRTPPSFTCPHCGAVMRQPRDVEARYCGRCHWWTGVPEMYLPWLLERQGDNAPTGGRPVSPPKRPVVAPFDYSHERRRLDVDTVTGRFWSRPVAGLDAAGVLNEPGHDPLDRMTVTSSPEALIVVLRCDDCRDETAVARRPTPDGIGPPLTLAELVRAARGHVCDEEGAL